MYICMHSYALVFVFIAPMLRCRYAMHGMYILAYTQPSIGLHNCLASTGNCWLAVLRPDVSGNPLNSSGCWLLNVIDRRGWEANRREIEERGGAC
jgi:hypothetical protein